MIKWILILALVNGKTGSQAFDTKEQCLQGIKVIEQKINAHNDKVKTGSCDKQSKDSLYIYPCPDDINYAYITCQEGISIQGTIEIRP